MAQDLPRQVVPGRVELGLARLRLAPRLDILAREPARRVARHGTAATLCDAAGVRAGLQRPILCLEPLLVLDQEFIEPRIHPCAALEEGFPCPQSRAERALCRQTASGSSSLAAEYQPSTR
jgi:hypothetical protein